MSSQKLISLLPPKNNMNCSLIYSENHNNLETLVELHSVSVKYGNKQVPDIKSHPYAKGESGQLTGSNENGKSTYILMITVTTPKLTDKT